MKKAKPNFYCKKNILLIGGIVAVTLAFGILPWMNYDFYNFHHQQKIIDTDYGNFLAEQHALYITDFDAALSFAKKLENVDVPIVQNTNAMAVFLAGKFDDSAKTFKNDKSITGRLIYSTYLASNDDWKSLYSLSANNNSAFLAPIRIWSGIATNHITVTLKFVDSLPANDSWKNFLRGQIYGELGKTEKAAEYFDKVSTDFLNINDYLYMMAFYENAGMEAKADNLHTEFTKRPGGLFMLNFPSDHDFKQYAGIRNVMAFGLVQTVSHSPILNSTDLSLMMLRMAEAIGTHDTDALHYYLGVYFQNAGQNANEQFNKIPENSIFWPFVLMKRAEDAESLHKQIRMLEKLVDKNPLFMPAINSLVAKKVSVGDLRDALSILDNALEQKNLPPVGRAFLLKTKARVEIQRGRLKAAQKDIRKAANILPNDTGIVMEQAKIWALEGKHLDDAHSYAVALVSKFPTDIEAWDTLGLVVWKKEGPKEALEIMGKVGQVAVTVSSLFEHLGDIYMELGDKKLAAQAYQRAIDLSDDGLSVRPLLEKKLRKIK